LSLVDLFLFPHFIVMLSSLAFISIGLMTVAFHEPEQWFFLHKLFIGIGLLVAIIGLIVLLMLNLFILHALFGLTVIILLVLSATGGYIASEKKDQTLRKGHIWIGRGLYVLALVTVILGILTFLGFL